MGKVSLTTYTLVVFFLASSCYAELEEGISCSKHQTAFDGACYEFVGLQFSFLRAEGWCERGGGHLVFILNDETQQFLQTHLQPDKDWWLGLAPASPNLTLDVSPTEGSLAWLDGSDVSYSNWVNLPEARATCGYILRDTGFQWTATENCTQELNFICQFDFGRTVACEGQNATLQCGSGQVLEIEDAFYGRKTVHYCRSHFTDLPTFSQEECSWINVLESVTAHCRGLQACQAPLDLNSLTEPCPLMRSYLSVEYRCKDGLHLLMTNLTSVVDNVTITVKWLLHPFHGNLTCTVDAGDGHIIDPYNPEETESSIIHRFQQPGVFVVVVECTTSDWHVTAQKSITIQEPIGEFRVAKCYGSNVTTDGTKCNILYGSPAQIQLGLETGESCFTTKVFHCNDSQIANFSVDSGVTPHNITLEGTVLESLKHGCNNLTVAASNGVTPHPVSTDILLCLLEPVVGLQASVMAELDVCPDSQNLKIGVSLERGAPVELLFNLTGFRDTLTETRNMLNNNLAFSSEGPSCECPFKFSAGSGFSENTSSLPELPGGKYSIFEKNPFAWKEENITGTVASLSFTRMNSTVIPVENLPKEIEILLPRLDVGEQKSTVLDLANFSTLMIDIPSPEVTLVLKLEPSQDISFMVFLGYKVYPHEKSYVAKTQLPLENVNEVEKFTWLLSPKDRTGGAGIHFLLVKPIVEPGVKSVNATVTVTSIAAQCKYWNETKSSWSEDGCRVGPLTTPLVTQCLCNHLTFFGSSFFVMPNLVDVTRTAELFATFANNPVVVCFVGSIFAAYLLVVVWAHRKDIQDSTKVKITVLEDNDPLAEYRYMLTINTGHRHGASTSSQVTITLLGTEGESEPHHLTDPEKPVFERGGVDMFLLTTHFSLGDLQNIRLWHDNSGDHPAWYVNKVMVQDLETGQKWHFLCNSWLAVDMAECWLDKVFPVATESDLKRFSNLFFMKTAKDFQDGHIWFSVISRPPCSTFTRVQRVSCCFSLLLCTMLTSIMFWGIPSDPSEQTMDLGHIEFTWQQVMVGFQSSIIMFPINLLIVSIFRNTRPRDKAAKPEGLKQGNTVRVSPSQTLSPPTEIKHITADTVIKVKIAQSLSKAMKSPPPRCELHPGQQADINTLLSLVEDIIRHQNKMAGDFYSNLSKADSMTLSLGAVNLQENGLWVSPEKTFDEAQKKTNNSRYLYKQLRHVEKELRLLGPSRFPNTSSYNRAMQQVQGMKSHLEFLLDGDQLNRSPSPEESISSRAEKKRSQGGLPWWFVFVGWILVITTSAVSGYFTMMYGLTYGKDQSINWLISMVVSFFESLFITQPLKVLGFAAFFALVLKKVDQEEFGEPQIDEKLTHPGLSRRDSTCSFYQPPPPTDIERMRKNIIQEQKVFGLIREILAYMGFMWVLLLVAYGQRDPNAYFLSRHIRQSFSKGISNTMSIQDVFNWANTTLLSNLYGDHPGFITDGNSKLVGNARLRQVRVQKNSCRVAHIMQESVPDCHTPYSWESEDMGSYSPGWHLSVGDNTSLNPHSAWVYRSQSELRAFPIWGRVMLYRGGGFVINLGPDLQRSRRILKYLHNNTWLDVYTQAIFVEFTVYNANVNLFCIATLMLETTAIGYFTVFVFTSQRVGKLMRSQKSSYFKIKWNLLELAIIILSWCALSVFIKRTLLGKRDISFYQNNKHQFASFHETAQADAALGYLIAFLVLLATIKLWHLLRLNPKLHMITATLQRAWTDISGFLVVMTIMFLAYAIASNLMYGWKLYSYRTLLDAAQTIVSLQLGIFNYEEVLNYNPVLGAFLIGSCIVFMTFVVLNLFISVILVAFSQEQIHHKPSEEEEIVELMLIKFLCNLPWSSMSHKPHLPPKLPGINAPVAQQQIYTPCMKICLPVVTRKSVLEAVLIKIYIFIFFGRIAYILLKAKTVSSKGC
uniref:Polycystic kidney disease protein 1-like 2 n=1 Tax=Xiphophorus maculatus TaxID=8083 RepID=M3ZLU3_XIPMA